MTQVKAQLNGLRIAPRKIRVVTNLVKGKDVVHALNQMEFLIKRPVLPLIKLLNSAIANAENNFSMVRDNLYIKSIFVDEGIKLKRFRAKGFGRAAAIQKKTSHIRIILDELKPGLRMEKSDRVKKENEEASVTEAKITKGKGSKPEIKREMGSKGNTLGNLGRKIFQRKSV